MIKKGGDKKCGKNEIYRIAYKTKKGKLVEGNCIKKQTYGKKKREYWSRAQKAKKTKTKKIIKKKYPEHVKKKCPEGQILRDGYVRKSYIRKDGKVVKKITVAPGCIKDRGQPGKWTNKNKNVKGIGPLKKGTLAQFGYKDVKKMTIKNRRIALTKCVKKLGNNTCWRKLNAIFVYNKNTNPKISKIFMDDRDWIKKTYG